MRETLAPLLFDEEEMAEASSKVFSVVAQAQKSKKAKSKAATKRNEENLPVHSFATLLQDLCQYIRARGWTQEQAAEFWGETQPRISNLMNG